LKKHSDDDRNFVRKAVNWALRQIGKRNLDLNKQAIETAERIKLQNTKSARWIASDALRELRSDAVIERLKGKSGRG
jgi:3-methyladenine DNA glycosylase AlkD